MVIVIVKVIVKEVIVQVVTRKEVIMCPGSPKNFSREEWEWGRKGSEALQRNWKERRKSCLRKFNYCK